MPICNTGIYYHAFIGGESTDWESLQGYNGAHLMHHPRMDKGLCVGIITAEEVMVTGNSRTFATLGVMHGRAILQGRCIVQG